MCLGMSGVRGVYFWGVCQVCGVWVRCVYVRCVVCGSRVCEVSVFGCVWCVFLGYVSGGHQVCWGMCGCVRCLRCVFLGYQVCVWYM